MAHRPDSYTIVIMTKTIIVWYRNDLRIHDHPALSHAAEMADHIVPVFIFNDAILKGRHWGSNRNRFLLESLADLKSSLKKLDGDLVFRHGDSADELIKLALETGADAVYYTADYTSYAVKRDRRVEKILHENGIEPHSFGGRTIVSGLAEIKTKAGTVHKVFTPFYRAWLNVKRRPLAEPPKAISLPSGLDIGTAPSLADIIDAADLSPDVLKGGETEALRRFDAFLKTGMAAYRDKSNLVAEAGTSKLSSYLHFGCISPRQIEDDLPDNEGSEAWHRQLAWSDFYNYVLLYNPHNARHEFQEKYRGTLKWPKHEDLLQAWRDGQTGYPVVDAAMRQLKQEGWMHNRARLIVGSFLTKDLWQDWRHGETWFMRMLTDGDEANNNGNWQWIASVGVDPAPVFRRLYNPASQLKNYDPDGEYVRRYVPELKNVPLKSLAEPWTMSEEQQRQAGCIIGSDYPAPVVDHKEARAHALAQYGSIR
jgi:deoxyribodipyrimidine photo-lyase